MKIMSNILITDILDELREENNRLFNENKADLRFIREIPKTDY